jgi:hypothetical protein
MTERRTFNTPIREPWNPIIYSLLKAIDNHMALYLHHRDLLALKGSSHVARVCA